MKFQEYHKNEIRIMGRHTGVKSRVRTVKSVGVDKCRNLVTTKGLLSPGKREKKELRELEGEQDNGLGERGLI